MQVAYRFYPEQAEKLKSMLSKNAHIFGIDPAQIDEMKAPVLVRVIDEYIGEGDFLIYSKIFNVSILVLMEPLHQRGKNKLSVIWKWFQSLF